MFSLSGKIALVTGAGQGVGFGIAQTLIQAGAVVYINDVLAERANTAAEKLGPNARPLPFDVSDFAQVEIAITTADPVDILINNAGIPASMRAVKFRDLPREEWGPYVDVNLYGVLNCVKATIDGMCERKWGRIITISSGAGTEGLNIGVSIYGAGKGAGISFMRHLAIENAGDGVTANTLALGLMERNDPGVTEEQRTVTAKIAKTVPTGRLGTGADVGFACVYLASEEASWMTGQTISLNGGSVTS
ncbi:MAG: SDR family NAD(P)-dependent oxidoreductase [Acidimicrobiales bacterium]